MKQFTGVITFWFHFISRSCNLTRRVERFPNLLDLSRESVWEGEAELGRCRGVMLKRVDQIGSCRFSHVARGFLLAGVPPPGSPRSAAVSNQTLSGRKGKQFYSENTIQFGQDCSYCSIHANSCKACSGFLYFFFTAFFRAARSSWFLLAPVDGIHGIPGVAKKTLQSGVWQDK